MAIADLDVDGHPDLVVTDETTSEVSVLRGRGDGTFHAALGFTASPVPVYIVSSDFNGDGRPDLAFGGGSVTVMLSQCP